MLVILLSARRQEPDSESSPLVDLKANATIPLACVLDRYELRRERFLIHQLHDVEQKVTKHALTLHPLPHHL